MVTSPPENTDTNAGSAGKPPLPAAPPMSKTEFRTLYSGLGGVMFVAGLSLYATWVGTTPAPQASSNTVNRDILLGLGLFLIVLAIYLFIACLLENPKLWLPRKTTILSHEQTVLMHEAIRVQAETALSQAVTIEELFRIIPELTYNKVAWWQDNIWGTVANAWGFKESSLFVKALPVTDQSPVALIAYVDSVSPVLRSICERSHAQPINHAATLSEANNRLGKLAVQFQSLIKELKPPTPSETPHPPSDALNPATP